MISRFLNDQTKDILARINPRIVNCSDGKTSRPAAAIRKIRWSAFRELNRCPITPLARQMTPKAVRIKQNTICIVLP